jgi:dolichol-phosphate mannosyltransferase
MSQSTIKLSVVTPCFNEAEVTGHVVAGWSSLMVVVLLIGSAQLFVLGIMGEYLGQIYLESKGRPLFIINHIYRRESAPSEESGAIKGNSKES